MAPVARELAERLGVLEPLQTADSISGQIEELAQCLQVHGSGPISLIGHSWGAWLAVLLAARRPELVRQLVLVSSGPFTEAYAASILPTRLDRLPPPLRLEARRLLAAGETLTDAALARLGALLSQADAYDPEPADPFEEPVPCRADIFAKIWPEAAALRRSGTLLDCAASVRCPILAIHGDHDPHPAAGVRDPLSQRLPDFACIVLPHCGHAPWRERQAREPFYRALLAALPDARANPAAP
jgi:pimeloyl-ACP methyl ester carboxylesterase